MRGLLINVLILGFLLTLYVYVNTDHEKTVIKENSAQTTELETAESENSAVKQDTSYRVQNGDTLSQIGERFHVSVGELKEFNGLTKDELSVGEYIDIPGKNETKGPELASKDEYAPYGDPDSSQTMTQSLGEGNSSDTEQQSSERQAEIEKRRQELIQQRQQYHQQVQGQNHGTKSREGERMPQFKISVTHDLARSI